VVEQARCDTVPQPGGLQLAQVGHQAEPTDKQAVEFITADCQRNDVGIIAWMGTVTVGRSFRRKS
jgi:hypothetical protein